VYEGHPYWRVELRMMSPGGLTLTLTLTLIGELRMMYHQVVREEAAWRKERDTTVTIPLRPH